MKKTFYFQLNKACQSYEICEHEYVSFVLREDDMEYHLTKIMRESDIVWVEYHNSGTIEFRKHRTRVPDIPLTKKELNFFNWVKLSSIPL